MRARDLSISALILSSAFSLYFLSVDSHAPSIRRENFVLDADIVHVSNVVARGHRRNLERHPLYGLFLGAPGSIVDSFLEDPITTGRVSSAAAGAVACLAAFWFFVRLLGSRVDAAWFCLLASCSASVWLLAAIPETHVYNYLAVVTGFAMLGAMERVRSPALLSRCTWLAIPASVFLMGITVTNIVYPATALGLALCSVPLSPAQRLRRFAAFLGVVLLSFAAASAVELYLEPDEFNFLTAPTTPLDNEFIRWSGFHDPASLAGNARMFLLGNVIASPPRIELVPSLGEVQQMIQLSDVGGPELLILGWLALTSVLLAARRAPAGFGAIGIYALLVLLFNLALHQVFSGNGQPFLFSIHGVLPLVVLLALLYRASRADAKRLLVGGLAAAIVVQNAFFLASVNGLLARRCIRQEGDPVICVSWLPTTSP